MYLNFEDGTVRVEHLIPLVQSFMSDQKGVFYLYKCYRACPWEKSRKGKERMMKNKGYLDPSMNNRTISIVTRGAGESLVATFDTVEEYEMWLHGLRAMQNQTGKYFSFFFNELEALQIRKSIRKIAQKRWAALRTKNTPSIFA